MSNAKAERDNQIRIMYQSFRMAGKKPDAAFDAIAECEMNQKYWGLSRASIKIIATWKGYGKKQQKVKIT